MNRMGMSFTCVLAIVSLIGCHGHGHGHDHEGAGQEEEKPTVAVTRWTERTELFMEYPVLVAGESGRSAIHVTDLADFSPLSTGQAVVVLRAADGHSMEFRGGASRPGIFGVDLEPDRPGEYVMTLRVDAPNLQDVHEVGPVRVHEAGTPLPEEKEEAESISFLKEQQWTLEFGTAPVEERRLRSSITVPAVVEARVGGDAVLSAPVPGRIDAATPVPVPGMVVRAGAVLARIVPSSDDLRDAAGLRADLVDAEQRHHLASQERDRVGRLVEARALPARRLLEAEAELTSAGARLEAARQRWGRYDSLSDPGRGTSAESAYTVRAPFDGVVSEVRLSPGASVEQSQPLLRLVDPDHLHVVGAVPESRAAALASLEAGELLRKGEPPVPLGRPLSVGRVIDPVSRSMEVRFTLANRDLRLQVGRSVDLRLFLRGGETRPAIPESAIVDDGGRPVVFVQTGGESFDRRPVRLGSREQGFVHVLEGVGAGERVVHEGAYLVRLAAMSTKVPSHGHVH